MPSRRWCATSCSRLERIPPEIVELGLMSGSNRRQLLWWVQIPSGLPTILIGVNQTVMAGLSMVVIAAMVGGVDDIGLEVFNTMKQAKFGQSLLAGLVIALLAMITDRISRGFAYRQGANRDAAAERRALAATRDRGNPRRRAGRTAADAAHVAGGVGVLPGRSHERRA